MSALFDFKAFLTVVLLTICACTFVKARFPKLLNERTGCVTARSYAACVQQPDRLLLSSSAWIAGFGAFSGKQRG